MAMDLESLLEREGGTSFSFAATQAEAVSEALKRRPDFITSDVTLTKGTGPLAVSMIQAEIGPIPTIFITATPDACSPCDSETLILSKPFDRPAIVNAFRRLVTER